MCRDVEGNLFTNESEVINRWKQYFNEQLNGDDANRDAIGVELEEPAADNTFPAPQLQEIQQIRKLKNNRAAGKDHSIYLFRQTCVDYGLIYYYMNF